MSRMNKRQRRAMRLKNERVLRERVERVAHAESIPMPSSSNMTCLGSKSYRFAGMGFASGGDVAGNDARSLDIIKAKRPNLFK